MPLALAGCLDAGTADHAGEPDLGDLEDGLSLGKADAATSGITVFRNGLGLRGAAARTLYNMLDASDARAVTGGGNRVLYGAGLGCITNGLATYCELYGRADDGFGGYEAVIHGNRDRSAAATLMDLIGGAGSFVETPWFACERSGAVWCGVETSEPVALSFDPGPIWSSESRARSPATRSRS